MQKRQPGLGRCPQTDETQTAHCLALHGFCTLAPGRCPQTSRALWSGGGGSTRAESAPLCLWDGVALQYVNIHPPVPEVSSSS